jgi:hypothetical protein
MQMLSIAAFPARTVARAVISVAAIATSVGALSAETPQQRTASRALLIHYADGRTIPEQFQPDADMWTPLFPRVPGANTTKDGLPLNALGVGFVIEGDEIVVTVSLLYGKLHQRRVTVATRRMGTRDTARIDELEAFGVQPIELSIADIPVASTYAPAVETPSAWLEFRVEPAAQGVPAYRAVVVNRSTRAVVAFFYTSFKSGQKSFTGGRRDDRHFPLIAPGAEYVFGIPMGSGLATSEAPQEWQPLDRVVLRMVVWDDGTVEGDPETALRERKWNEGCAKEIEFVLATLRRSDPAPAALRHGLESALAKLQTDWPVDEQAKASDRFGMRHVLKAALADLEQFEGRKSDQTRALYSTWRQQTIAEYAEWLERVRSILPPPAPGIQ